MRVSAKVMQFESLRSRLRDGPELGAAEQPGHFRVVMVPPALIACVEDVRPECDPKRGIDDDRAALAARVIYVFGGEGGP